MPDASAPFRRLLDPLTRRVRGMIARAVIKLVDDAKKAQELQVTVLAGQVSDRVESFGHYGFTSVPPAGTEAILVAVGGARDHLVAIATESREHRPTQMQSGEVQLYSDEGARVHLRQGQLLDLVADGRMRVEVLGATVEMVPDRIQLSLGSSSITIDPDKITIKAALVEFLEA